MYEIKTPDLISSRLDILGKILVTIDTTIETIQNGIEKEDDKVKYQ